MMTLDMLADSWPEEYKQNLEMSLKQSPPPPVPILVPPTIPSPSDLVLLLSSVKAALKTGEMTMLEDILWMPITSFPNSGIPLLTKIITQEMTSSGPTMNLSGYALSDPQIIHITSSFSAEMKTLNLSYNDDTTVNAVCQILMTFPLLKCLILLRCTSLTRQQYQKNAIQTILQPRSLHPPIPPQRQCILPQHIFLHWVHYDDMFPSLLLAFHHSSTNRPLTLFHLQWCLIPQVPKDLTLCPIHILCHLN
jgi:hypothetical protein